MKFKILLVVIATIVVTGECIVCYQCIDGERTDDMPHYKTCNRFIENLTCNTTWQYNSCVMYASDHLHKRTVIYDCFKEEKPIKHGIYTTRLCNNNYCNRDENWGRYNKASSMTLHTSLGLVLIASLYFL